jgi:hypothetical protein
MKHRTTRFPVAQRRQPSLPRGFGGRAMSLSTSAVEIDGMEVIADERVTLFPVTLIEIPPRRVGPHTNGAAGSGHGSMG